MSNVNQKYLKDENNEIFSPVVGSDSVYFNGENDINESLTNKIVNLKKYGTYLGDFSLAGSYQFTILFSEIKSAFNIDSNSAYLFYRILVRTGQTASGICMYYNDTDDYTKYKSISIEGTNGELKYEARRGSTTAPRVGVTQPLTSSSVCDTSVIEGKIHFLNSAVRNSYKSCCITDSSSRTSDGFHVCKLSKPADRLIVHTDAGSKPNLDGSLALWSLS